MARLDRGVVGLLSESWGLYTKNMATWAKMVTMMVVPLLVYFLGYGLIFLAAENEAAGLGVLGGIIAVVGYVAALLAGMWLGVASIEAANSFADKKKYSLRDIWSLDTWSLIIQMGVASLLYVLVMYLGFFLLIIPGIIFAIWFMFVKYVVVLERKNDLYALQYSYQIVKGRWWQVFWRCFSFGVIMGIVVTIILGVLFGIGYMATMAGGETVGMSFGILLMVLGLAALMYVFTPIAVQYYTSLYKDLKKTA